MHPMSGAVSSEKQALSMAEEVRNKAKCVPLWATGNKTDTFKQMNENFNRLVLFARHMAMAEKVIAYLALTWSTVVLLGGYVNSLEKNDFSYLTLISLAEATRIFDGTVLDEKLGQSVISFMSILAQMIYDISTCRVPTPPASRIERTVVLYLLRWRQAVVLLIGIAMAPVAALILSMLVLVEVSPLLFLVLSVLGIRQHNSKQATTTLVLALKIFYFMVLLQGILSVFLAAFASTDGLFSRRFLIHCEFPMDWGQRALQLYFHDTLDKFKKDLGSIQEQSLFSHASELMGSESGAKYVTGVRVLGTLAKQRVEDYSIFTTLLSREKVQRLILTLGLTQPSTIKEVPDLDLSELREHAARIVAGLADGIHLAQFPGAMRCISTLLESSQNELIVQGLVILDKLAQDHHNCQEICSTPGLLPKIMAPICSSDLIEDPKITRSRVVRGTFEVLRRLIRVPGEDGRTLRHEISCNKQAVTNLEIIIVDQGNQYGDELQMLAMEILLELADDQSVNLSQGTIQTVMKKQLQVFLSEEGEATAAKRDMAGKVLSVLSTNSETNCNIIIDGDSDSIGHLIEIIDSKNNIWHRIYAMETLRNLCKLCASCNKELPDEILLLPKVLSEILLVSKEEQQTTSSDRGDNEENHNPTTKKLYEILLYLMRTGRSDRVCDTRRGEQSDLKELQEALLSLTLQLCNIIGADRFALVAQQVAPGDGAFVASLKSIVDRNCEATPTSLRIVKLCCQIAISMSRRYQYRVQFKDLEFMESVSKASGIMSETESCMLITGTTGLEKKETTLRPLLSELENKLKQKLVRAG